MQGWRAPQQRAKRAAAVGRRLGGCLMCVEQRLGHVGKKAGCVWRGGRFSQREKSPFCGKCVRFIDRRRPSGGSPPPQALSNPSRPLAACCWRVKPAAVAAGQGGKKMRGEGGGGVGGSRPNAAWGEKKGKRLAWGVLAAPRGRRPAERERGRAPTLNAEPPSKAGKYAQRPLLQATQRLGGERNGGWGQGKAKQSEQRGVIDARSRSPLRRRRWC